MSDHDPLVLRPWVAIGGGLLAGAAAALAVMAVWTLVNDDPRGAVTVVSRPARVVPHFRSAAGAHEVVLVPAGPDGTGELALSRAAFPGEEPPRDLVEMLLANVSRDEAWDVDLTSAPLRARTSGAGEWGDLAPVPVGETLSSVERLRARSLGGGVESVRIEPGSLRRVLLALPAGREFRQLSDVQWGEHTFRRGEFGVEELYAFREDPAATGRRPDLAATPKDQEQPDPDRASTDDPGSGERRPE